jgi:hypothetical protein
MCLRFRRIVALLLPAILLSFPLLVNAQDEALPAIAREVYRPHTELPPAPAPRVVTERLVTEPPIVPQPVVDDTPTAVGAVVTRGAVVAPAVVSTPASAFSRFRFGFYDDGNVDDNWFYDYYEVPKAAVVVRPATDAMPGFRTTWTYAPLYEQGIFNW